jgi:hypothetical protein
MGGFQMPQPIRNWYFEPDPVPPEAGSTGDDDGVAPGLVCLPAASLRQHGGGFATRSGTSFAAPLSAAHIAARLLDQASVHSVDRPGAQAATDRTLAALASLDWPGRS